MRFLIGHQNKSVIAEIHCKYCFRHHLPTAPSLSGGCKDSRIFLHAWGNDAIWRAEHTFQMGSNHQLPGDSKWPFRSLVGGHLTLWKGHLSILKGRKELQGSFRFSANFVIERSEVCTLPPVADGRLIARTGWGFHQECLKNFAKIMIYDQVLTLPVQVCTNITTRWAPSLVINGKKHHFFLA